MNKIRETQDTPEVFGTEEALAKIAMEMLKPQEEKLFTVSDITPKEVFYISLIRQYSKVFKSDIVENWIKDFLLLRISRFRIGRREFILLGTGIKEAGEKKKAGIKDLYSGLR